MGRKELLRFASIVTTDTLLAWHRRLITKILRETGIAPAPGRRKGMTWKEFLRMHWNVVRATDFLKAEVWTPAGLVRYHVLFLTRLATREIQIAGMVPEPEGQWMNQMARNLTGPNGRPCVEQLPERSPELIRLRYYENTLYDEIARSTGRSLAALYMAFTRIHDSLEQCVNARIST